jgi:hypothetical protein
MAKRKILSTDINSEIKAYFEGFYGSQAALDESGYFYGIRAEGEEGGCFVIAMKYMVLKILANYYPSGIAHLSHLPDDAWVYPFNGQLNEEAKMVRLLNLRAFL